MPPPLRYEEELVIAALAAEFGGSWRPGEDPPDAYLEFAGQTAAVEISILTQQVEDDRRGVIPRRSQDMTALSVIDEIKKEISGQIPDGTRVRIWLDAPVIHARRLKRPLAKRILEITDTNYGDKISVKEEILGNNILINVIRTEDKSASKIMAAVTNRSGHIDILENAKFILFDRLAVKKKKVQSVNHSGPVWLALLNHYWLADADAYRAAMASIHIEHPFDKILLVSDDKIVNVLFDR